jgi:peptidoglycan/xylan/chitin deacetylase (PgdA/CDA1 family)
VTLSVEVELGWGYHDLGRTDPFSENRIAETERLDALLSACDRLEIPFTFDVVGALLLDSWPDDLDGPHADGWFDAIPKTGVDEDPLYYAPGMVRAIDDAAVDHEICTHTFSHVLFDRISREVAAWELQQAQRVNEAFGLDPPVSLVPPRHYRPPRDVLVEHGIETLRIPGYLPARTKVHKFDRLLASPQPPTPPRLVDDVVETYCTSFTSLTAASLPAGQLPVHPVFRPIPRSLRTHLHERYLNLAVERAIEADSYTHLWCHLYDMTDDDQFDPIVAFLETLAERWDRGAVEVLTMADLGDAVRADAEPSAREHEAHAAPASNDGGERQ